MMYRAENWETSDRRDVTCTMLSIATSCEIANAACKLYSGGPEENAEVFVRDSFSLLCVRMLLAPRVCSHDQHHEAR